jgi:hypothetical protein
MRRTLVLLLLAAPLACASPSGPRAADSSFAAPRTPAEAEARLQFLEKSLDGNRRHAQIWYWSWLGLNGGGMAASAYTAAATNDSGERAFNIIEASQAALGLLDMLVLRPLPGLEGAAPLRDAGARGVDVDARVKQGEAILIAAAHRAEESRDWRLHAANFALQAVSAGVLLALHHPGYAGLTMAAGMIGGEANLWSEPYRAAGDLADYRKLVETGALPGEPNVEWLIGPTSSGVALQLRY